MNPPLILLCFISAALCTFYFMPIAFSVFLIMPVLIIQKKKVMLIALLSGIICGSFLNIYITYERKSSFTGLEPGIEEQVELRLSEDSFLSSRGRQIYKGDLISVGNEYIQSNSKGSVLIIGNLDSEQFYWGERIIFPCSLSIMEDSRELSFIGFFKGEAENLTSSDSIFFKRRVIKKESERKMKFFSKDVFSLFNALFTGNSDYLDPEVKDLFKKCGINHLLALSGFHVAILVLLMTAGLRILVGRSVSIIISIPFLILYLFYTGPSPSLVRAVFMYCTGGLFLLFHKEVTLFTVLLITCLIQLITGPVQGLNLSFQLSYLALTGIIILGKKIDYMLKPWMPSFLRLPFSASLGAHIFTAPLLIFYFHEVYPVGVIASVVVTPLITLFMWISLFAYLLSMNPLAVFITNYLNRFCEILLKIIIAIVKFFSKVPGISFSTHSDIILYLSMLMIVVLSLYIDFWRIYGRGQNPEFKLRLTIRNKIIAGNYGSGPKKKMEPELSDQ